MKISKITSIAILGSSLMFLGCGNGSSSSSASIKASDAYVVKLNSPAKLVIGNEVYETTTVENGKVIFNLPFRLMVDSTTHFYIPGDAIVDTDGDGKYSSKDQQIRMPLETLQPNTVANPLTTVAVLKNDKNLYESVKTFDPVEAKKQLILNPNDNKLKVLVAASDAIAFLAKKAKESGKDPITVLKAVNLTPVASVVTSETPTITNITTLVEEIVAPASQVADINVSEVVTATVNVLNVIEIAHQAVQEGSVDPDTALVTVIAVSDANVNPDVATQALETGNVEEVINSIPENETYEEEGITPPSTPPAPSSPTISNVSYTLTKVYFGNHEVTINSDGSFIDLVNLATESNNIRDYFDVNLSNLTVNGNDGTYEGNLTVKVTHPTKGDITLTIENVKVSKNGDNITTTFERGVTKIAVTVNGLRNVESALGVNDGQTFYATVDNTITNTDLVFNVNTIINNAILSQTNRDKLNNAIDALNGYFNEANNSYTVNIIPQFNNVVLTPSSLNGVVNVVNIPLVTLPISQITGTLRSGEVIDESITYTPADANISCSFTGDYNLSCNASNGVINITGTAPNSGDINTTLSIVQYAPNGLSIKNINIPINMSVISIPSNAVELVINDSVDTNSSDDVTVRKTGTLNGDLQVYFVPVEGNPSNSSATIIVKNSNGDVIATISPDDRYDEQPFYILYNGELKIVTYDKDVTGGEIVVSF